MAFGFLAGPGFALGSWAGSLMQSARTSWSLVQVRVVSPDTPCARSFMPKQDEHTSPGAQSRSNMMASEMGSAWL